MEQLLAPFLQLGVAGAALAVLGYFLHLASKVLPAMQERYHTTLQELMRENRESNLAIVARLEKMGEDLHDLRQMIERREDTPYDRSANRP